MPTKGRHDMAVESVEMFRRQTYWNRELIIMDDSEDPSFPAGVKSTPGVPITHLLHAHPRTIGAKRNLACKAALGEIIIHWDDDDLYSSDRIEHQVRGLIDSGAAMAGYNLVPFIRTDDNAIFAYNGQPGMIVGTSLCYWKTTWKDRPFQDIQIGEDTDFWVGRDAFSCGSGGRVIARIHPGKTDQTVYRALDNRETWRPVSAMAEAIALSQ